MLDQNDLDSSYNHYHWMLINSFMQRKITGEGNQPIAWRCYNNRSWFILTIDQSEIQA